MACGPISQTIGRRRLLPAGLCLALLLGFAGPVAAAAPLKTTVAAHVDDGYARLVFTASEYIDGTARIAGNVLIISFNQPVDIAVDRLSDQVPDYIGAARRDPDGKAIRVALARNVTVNAQSAGEKLFVDLMPDTWQGVPPGLPQDVVKELARRAREAQQIVQRERQMTQQKNLAPISVHVAVQPTFTRYVFDVPDQVPVSADRSKDRLVVNFGAAVTFDLADAQAALPASVADINSERDGDTALVRFIFAAKVEPRSFRDEKGFVVDIPNAESLLAPPQGDAAPAGDGAAGAAIAAVQNAAKAAAGNPAEPSVPNPQASSLAAPPAPNAPIPAAPQSPAQSPQRPVTEAAPQAAAPRDPPRNVESNAAQPPAAPPAPASAPQPAVAPNAAANTALNTIPNPAPNPAPSTPPAASPAAAANAPPVVVAAAGAAGNKIGVDLARQGANLKLSFPFRAATPAAVFARADMLWIVFDTAADFDLSALDGEPSRTIRGYEVTRNGDAAIVRLKLDRPHLASAAADGAGWTVEIGDSVLDPTHALEITRNLIGANRSSVTIAFDGPQKLHRLTDPEAGDTLAVVTALAPARGFINPQDFIEYRALASTQGVVIEPLADDLTIDLAPDKIVIGRPNGLTLSTALQPLLHGSGLRPVMFDSQVWGFDRQASYGERQATLIAAAAAAPDNKRLSPRLDLARFYLAREMYAEAKGVLDIALAEERPAAESVSATILRAVAEVMMNRPDDALKDLSDPAIGDQHDAPLWRALAYARQGKWAQAREAFKTVEATIATLPIELQRVALKDEMRAAIEVGDFDGASTDLNDFETIGVPHDMEPVIAVLMGRLAEGMGRAEDALTAYRTAADSWDRPAAAQGLLREIALRYSLGDLKRDDVINQLESLTTIWRGDETEIEALKVLAHLYTEDGRYRDAFYVMRSAMAAHPDSTMTRQIQDEAAATFDSLFLAGKGDAMPAIDALALFYDFRELTPVGNRGDEMIRRLADRLASVDLLDQAADLLQYQVDNRLEGAARAQVATRLAVIYLMNRKPDRALATLRATRAGDLANDLRNQRLLLEGRALSDLGRHDLALEVISNVDGPAAIRLRSDILWTARRWGESAEQIELMYGDRYKDFQPLTDIERQDILRAEIGYALAEDTLGLGRFRDKFAAKMAQTPDARAFEIVSAPLGTSGAEFSAIAHAAASVDTLEGFLRDMKTRYPDDPASSQTPPAAAAAAPPATAAAAPSAPAAAPPAASPPAAAKAPPSPPDMVLPPMPPPRAAGRTAQR
jgi:tetratricopeptide (TPR) repeat protein